MTLAAAYCLWEAGYGIVKKKLSPENFCPRIKIFSNCAKNFCPTLKIFVCLARPCLEFSTLLNVFPTACFTSFIISFIIATPGMISGSFLATRWVTPRAMRIQSVTVATEQPETTKHWQELTVVMFLYNWQMD